MIDDSYAIKKEIWKSDKDGYSIIWQAAGNWDVISTFDNKEQRDTWVLIQNMSGVEINILWEGKGIWRWPELDNRRKRKIVSAAIKKGSEIYVGTRHFIIAYEHPGALQNGIQGFMTDDGLFVTREDAAQIAFDAGQTKELKKNLISEDLW